MLWLLACTPAPIDSAPPPRVDSAPVVDTQAPALPTVDQLPLVRLNEVQTRNDSTVMSPQGIIADWVELRNGHHESVALERLTLRDGDGDSWRGGAGELAPGELLMLWADEDLPFGLNREGERLELLIDGVVVDRLATGELPRDLSWGRFPDGGDWATTARPTPGWSNGSRPNSHLDASDTLFTTERVHRISLSIPSNSWAVMLADSEEYAEVSLGFGAVWLPSVGVRRKGRYGSFRSLDQKAALKLDLNRYADHHIRGQELLNLNNMVQDPTYVAEHLAYTVFRAAGVPAPRVGWTRLQVNGEDWGLYAVVENVDDAFLRRWWVDGSGPMWEGAYGVDFEDGDIDGFDHDEGVDDRSQLQAVADLLETPATDTAIEELERLVDLDGFLRNMAVEGLILHWDGYTTSNNYRVYQDPISQRLSIIPWGTDQTFRSHRYSPWEGRGLVHQYCLQNPACADRYDHAVVEVAELMMGLELESELDRVLALLSEHIADDPRVEFDPDTHQSYVDTLRATLQEWPPQVRDAATERINARR